MHASGCTLLSVDNKWKKPASFGHNTYFNIVLLKYATLVLTVIITLPKKN